MDTLIVQVPDKIREQLNKRAQSEGKDPQAVALEILERDLGTAEEKAKTPSVSYDTEEARRERVYQKLREEGLIRPLSDELRKQIKDPASIEEVREILSRTGGKPLSQIVIDQRQERHDILVYGYKRAHEMVRERERKRTRSKARRGKRK